MTSSREISPDGSLILKKAVKLPEILDILIVGGGPGGTAAVFRAKELGLSALVIDFDDLMKRIRDYAKDKLILPDFGGGDKMKFPKGDKLFSLLHFSPIDKDDMCALWKKFYYENNIPAHIGIELTCLQRRADGVWEVKAWNHKTKSEQGYLARHVVISIGRGVPRRFDIPGNLDGIAYRLDDAETYVNAPACVIGGGTSAAEAVIAISNAKAKANDPTAVYWSYRGDSMPKISKGLADVFFEAYVGNGNIRYYPKSEPAAVVVAEDRKEYLSIRIDRKRIDGRPNECAYLEFPKENCITCIGEDIPEAFLNSLGIYMAIGGANNKKRMVVSPFLETQQPNIYLAGAILAPAYFVAEDFDADPATFQEFKHRDNIKSALIDGVYVAEVISQRLAGKKDIHVELEFVEDGKKEVKEVKEVKETIQKTSSAVDSEGPPSKVISAERIVEEHRAFIIRILPGDVQENEYAIKKNAVTTIGREGSDINFPEDTTLSEKHASISHGPDGYFLRDDGSVTGVYLRAMEARPLEVQPGHLVRAGRQFLLLGKTNGTYEFIHYDQTGKELKRYQVPRKTMVLGRDAPDIILDSQDMTLSRRHLAISLKENKVFIKDLKSVNGTFVKVKNAVKLEHGDRFRVGQQILVFSLKEDAVVDSGHFTSKSVVAPTQVEPPPTSKAEQREAVQAGELIVTFKNFDKTLPIKSGQTVCEVAEEYGIKINAECHAGICGSDPLRIISGKENLNKQSDQERDTLEDICSVNPDECRLACMTMPTGSIEVEII